MFFGRTDAEAEAPILWPPDAKSQLTGKDSDAGNDWGQEEKGMTVDEIVGLQHTRLPCPLLSPRVCSNSCPSSQWCHLTILSSVPPLFLLPSVFPSIRVFSSELALCIRWPKYWSFSFSISPCNEYSGLISFSIDLFDLLAVQGTLKSLLQHHNLKASNLWCLAFFRVQLSHL